MRKCTEEILSIYPTWHFGLLFILLHIIPLNQPDLSDLSDPYFPLFPYEIPYPPDRSNPPEHLNHLNLLTHLTHQIYLTRSCGPIDPHDPQTCCYPLTPLTLFPTWPKWPTQPCWLNWLTWPTAPTWSTECNLPERLGPPYPWPSCSLGPPNCPTWSTWPIKIANQTCTVKKLAREIEYSHLKLTPSPRFHLRGWNLIYIQHSQTHGSQQK